MDEDEYANMDLTPPLSSSRSDTRMPRKAKQAPQETVRRFWDRFNSRYPGKVYTVLPDNPYARTKAAGIPKGVIQGHNAAKSYEQARRECQRAVDRIINECRRLNQKYTDPHFDIEVDLKSGKKDYLNSLAKENNAMRPRGVKRVTEIFEKPQFYVNGPTASDVRQGRDGDCWFMAALGTLGNKSGLIENICVARDEEVGVYGFVFYRDGEWQQCIVDDKLYLRAADYDESGQEREIWDDIPRADTEEEYRKAWQTGSRALYFAQCVDENETWLPLLEKAYAKAHGDFSSIEGGFVGEAIEDLTGGVTSDILSSNILNKDKFWKEELMKVNEEFLFGCGTGLFSHWLADQGPSRDRKGISENHSYSIMEAREIDGVRLLRLRNPWGKKEWNGAWSDGSEQWTPEWMQKLNHRFGNDGFFWISYDDLLKKYQHFDRTRLFGPEWTVTQQWTSLNVPWSADYHSTKFMINVTQGGPVVIVLSQLDTRYFQGLVGEYDFFLKFRLQKEGEEDYFVRSISSNLISRNRSVNAEVDLEPGHYHVLVKVTAYRYENGESTEEAVSRLARDKREKLVQIGLSYDLAHAKGHVVETEEEKKAKEEREERRRLAERKKLCEETEKKLRMQWIRDRKMEARQQRIAERLSAKNNRNAAEEHAERRAAEQFYPDGPVQSPAEMASSARDRFDAKPANGTAPFKSLKQRKLEALCSSLDTTNGMYYNERALLEGFEFDPDLDMPEDPVEMKASNSVSCNNCSMDTCSDPWNAVCVVGLRVYSKDPQLSLEVVRPVPPESDTEASLDMDDPAASATLEKDKFIY